MEYSVTRLIGLGVALALVAALSLVVWNVMTDRAPDTATSVATDMGKIATFELCRAAGGTKTVAGNQQTGITGGTPPSGVTPIATLTTADKGRIPAGTICAS